MLNPRRKRERVKEPEGDEVKMKRSMQQHRFANRKVYESELQRSTKRHLHQKRGEEELSIVQWMLR